jgi:hypothetical protein
MLFQGRPFKWFLAWWPQKNWKNLNFWKESYVVNFKPISNTLEMDFKKDFDLPVLVHFNMFSFSMLVKIFKL